MTERGEVGPRPGTAAPAEHQHHGAEHEAQPAQDGPPGTSADQEPGRPPRTTTPGNSTRVEPNRSPNLSHSPVVRANPSPKPGPGCRGTSTLPEAVISVLPSHHRLRGLQWRPAPRAVLPPPPFGPQRVGDGVARRDQHQHQRCRRVEGIHQGACTADEDLPGELGVTEQRLHVVTDRPVGDPAQEHSGGPAGRLPRCSAS